MKTTAGRPNKIKPIQQVRGGFKAQFYNKDGKRQQKSLKTNIERTAIIICRDLEKLHLIYPDAFDKNILSNVYKIYHPTAYELYFRQERLDHEIVPETEGEDQAEATIRLGVAHAEIARLKQIEDYEKKYKYLASTLEGQHIIARESIPPTLEIMELYFNNLGLDQKKLEGKPAGDKGQAWRDINKFMKHMNFINICDITAIDLANYLDMISKDKSSRATADWRTRYKGFYQRFTQFYNFLRPYKVLDITREIVTPKPPDREGDIVFHTIKEIETAIYRLDEPIVEHAFYWKNVVAMMAYTGVLSSNLIGLKTTDITEDCEWLSIKSNEYRRLKTGSRKRTINIEQDRLRPVIEEYLDSEYPDHDGLLFPALHLWEKGQYGMWRGDTFSNKLRGQDKKNPSGSRTIYEGAIHSHVRSKTERLSFDQMTNLTLRHSFASLLLRGGLDPNSLSAVVGSDMGTIYKHYARKKGEEVIITGRFTKTNFKVQIKEN